MPWQPSIYFMYIYYCMCVTIEYNILSNSWIPGSLAVRYIGMYDVNDPIGIRAISIQVEKVLRKCESSGKVQEFRLIRRISLHIARVSYFTRRLSNVTRIASKQYIWFNIDR